MDEGIPFVLTPADQVTADYIRWTIRRRKRKSSPAYLSRQCEECKRLAMDATPMTEGEREREEGNVGIRGNSAKPYPAS